MTEHWRNPETGQIECECCCGWALDYEKLQKALRACEADNRVLRERCLHDFVRHLLTSARLTQFPIVSDELILMAMGIAAQGIEGLGKGPCNCTEADCPYRAEPGEPK